MKTVFWQQGEAHGLVWDQGLALVSDEIGVDAATSLWNRCRDGLTMSQFLEALAQTSALLSFTSMGEQLTDDMVVYFAGIDGARFKRPVEPGDQLILESTVDRVRAGIYKYSARATVDGMLAAEAELMCTMRRVG